MSKDKKREREPEEEVIESSADAEEASRKAAKKAKKAAKKAEKAAAAPDKSGKVSDDEDAVTKEIKDEKKKKDKSDKKHKTNDSENGGSLYVEHPITTALTMSQVEAHRTELGITVSPEEDGLNYKPITAFECLESSLQGSCPYIMTYLKNKQFAKPSPIQSQCWAPLLSGRDVVGIAATGSGKTLGFLIPGLLRMERLKASGEFKAKNKSNKPSPKILIVSPTRELAMQSHQVVEEMGGPAGVCIYGGVPKHTQKAALQAGAEIVVATPGRLMDLIDENAMSLSQVCYLVLDEADRM